jgi:hypothetical protein
MTRMRLFLGGNRRVAGDEGLERGLLETVPLSGEGLYITSHALDFRPLVDRLVACRALGGRVLVMIEGSNLVEEDVAGDHWKPGGDAESLRNALCALWRANVPVRIADSTPLLHANMVLSEVRRTLFATSANLTAKGLGSDANSGIEIEDDHVLEASRSEFMRLWRGGREDGNIAGTVIDSADGSVTVHIGVRSDTEHAIGRLLSSSRTRVRFAVFMLSSHSMVNHALVRLAERGVDVRGVVDGDQAGQPFDAVPMLRESGVDVRYVPGLLTGGMRRMHHKLLVSDGRALSVGTHNLSANARRHYELTVVVRGPAAKHACAVAEHEIEGLIGDSRASMPPLWSRAEGPPRPASQ